MGPQFHARESFRQPRELPTDLHDAIVRLDPSELNAGLPRDG
jgi:hypothetical protein